MFTENLIDHSLFPFKSSDTVDFAMETLLSLQVSALPVVDNGEIKGFVESTALEDANPDLPISEIIKPHPAWVINENSHFFESIKRLGVYKAGCLAITDSEDNFKGIVSKSSVINYLSDSYTLKAEGSVICIEMVARNYSLNELNRIIENDDAKILGVTLFNIPDSSRIMVTIKLNTVYTDRLIASLQRFGFEVTASFYNNHDGADFENRYQSLLKYLEF